MLNIILASGSPRRRELLTHLGVKFQVVLSGIDENSDETDPKKLAAELSLQKAQAVAKQHTKAIIIASDTVVALNDQILGKPTSPQQNAEFISTLAGCTHQVVTGVTIISPQLTQTNTESTLVTFRSLSEQEVQFYVQSGEGTDKAGGYGIQGIGMGLIQRIEGDYSNVVGFPLSLVIQMLRSAGIKVWEPVS